MFAAGRHATRSMSRSLVAAVFLFGSCRAAQPSPRAAGASPTGVSDCDGGSEGMRPRALGAETDARADQGSGSVALDAGADAPATAIVPRGERWGPDLRSIETCDDYRTTKPARYHHDPHGSKRKYGYNGYAYDQIEITREIDSAVRRHCVTVYWPPGDKNNDGKRVFIAGHIGAAWLRLIERTLQRIPWSHLQQVWAFVIDDRPVLHGVAPFSREAPATDARDGHTIWLHEHLFVSPNHWLHGNYGHYWGYHSQRDGVVVDRQPSEHDLFSPVLLHEIGHIVNYNVLNRSVSDPSCPKCAEMCGDRHNCDGLAPKEREAPCASAYCTGFEHSSGTENWAEMYRWFYQGSASRALLAERFHECFELLEGSGNGEGINAGRKAPWEEGLGEVVGYRKTLWDSCQGKACKPY